MKQKLMNANKKQHYNNTMPKAMQVLIGVASTWEKRKGLKDFLKLSKFLNSNQKLLLVGLSKKQMFSLPKNIIGISKTENKQELVDLYSVSDIFLNPSVEETVGSQ